MFNIDLQRHIESKHPETVKMEKNLLCDQCDYATNVKVNINMHKEFIHIIKIHRGQGQRSLYIISFIGSQSACYERGGGIDGG